MLNSAHPTGGTYKAKSRGALTPVPVPTGLFTSTSQTDEAWAILRNLGIRAVAAEDGPRLGRLGWSLNEVRAGCQRS